LRYVDKLQLNTYVENMPVTYSQESVSGDLLQFY